MRCIWQLSHGFKVLKSKIELRIIINKLPNPEHQGWKKGQHGMGNVRAYQPEAPPATEDDAVNPNNFSFKLVQVEVNNAKTGWSRYNFVLPQSVRAMYARDVVYGADWRALCQEFDDRCHCCT